MITLVFCGRLPVSCREGMKMTASFGDRTKAPPIPQGAWPGDEEIVAFRMYLFEQEKSDATIRKYVRDVEIFRDYIRNDSARGSREGPDKSSVLAYKTRLGETMALSSANTAIASLNAFFRYCGRDDLCVRRFRQQRDTITMEGTELTPQEVQRLIRAATEKGEKRLALGILTLAGCGARVSELRFFTVENVQRGVVEIRMKGKTRRIPIAASLQRELLRYCDRKLIRSGPIFVTRSGTGVDRSNFWRRLQKLAPVAGVDPVKLHPHNLRHYFARMYYKETHDLAGLADLLGHSSINVTRIYTAEDGTWYRRAIENVCAGVLKRDEAREYAAFPDAGEAGKETIKKQHNVSNVVSMGRVMLGFGSNVTISLHQMFCNMLQKYFFKTFSFQNFQTTL